MREDQDPYGTGYDVYGGGGGGAYQQPYQTPRSSAPTAGVAPYNPNGPQPVTGIRQTQTFDPNDPNRPLLHPGMSGQDILQATNSYQSGYVPGRQPGTPTQQVPSYVNGNDPVNSAVWQAFQAKGIQPRDASDFQYWVDKINSTGGFADEGNKNYWLNRLAQGQGGVGDYLGRPEAGASATGSSASGIGLFDPDTLNKIKSAFLQRLGGLSAPVTADDPGVAGAISANKITSQRGLENTRKALAEAAYAHGDLNTGGYQQAQQQALEHEGASEAEFAGNAVSQAQQQREQLLNQLLGLGGSISSNAAQLQLGNDRLGLDYATLQNSMNRDSILAALGGYGG